MTSATNQFDRHNEGTGTGGILHVNDLALSSETTGNGLPSSEHRHNEE